MNPSFNRTCQVAIAFCTFIILCPLLLGCSSTPSEGDAKRIIEQQIKDESEGRMKLIYFRKTNAQKREVAAVKFYQLEYEAEIEFQDDCKRLTDMLHIFDNTHSTFKTAPTQKQAESEGGFWDGWLTSTTQPGIDIFHFKGFFYFFTAFVITYNSVKTAVDLKS
jgi:hypothetical protein